MDPVSERPVPAAFPWAEAWRSVGVTGTNGKSTTTAMIAAALAHDDHPVLRATTVGYAIGEREVAPPGDWEAFLGLCAEAHAAGARRAAIELTSQALARGHARRWRFDIGVFTNLSPDHLKTHGTYEHYLASKAQLFVHLGPGCPAILNAADPCALLLDQVIPADVRRIFFAAPSRGPALCEPALAARAIDVDVTGTRIELADGAMAEALGGALEIMMIGEVFAEDALAAAAAALSAGVPGPAVRRALAGCPALAGRFEVILRRPLVIVDYAHTADALARACAGARGLVPRGQVIVVFGAGGETDPGKRGPMGEAVGAAADLAIVTSDNPRGEDPRAIAAALEAGCRRGGRARVEIELDRRAAILCALEAAGEGDAVIVAGKGHETGQTIAGVTTPFSDPAVIRELAGVARPRAGC